jgi:exonuclease-1
MKARVDAQRRELRREHLAAGSAALGRPDESMAAAKHFAAAVTITPLMARQLIQTLRKLGVDFVVAPYEADAQLAWLVREGHCAAALTEDSDLLAYQCPTVLYKIKSDGHARLYSWADLRTISAVGGRLRKQQQQQAPQLLFDGSAGWPDEWQAWEASLVTDMCILSGCDYLPSIPGVGLKTAHATLRQFRSVERALATLLADKAALGMPPELYLSLINKAQMVFLHQRVWDVAAKRVVPLRAFPDGDDYDHPDYARLAIRTAPLASGTARSLSVAQRDRTTWARQWTKPSRSPCARRPRSTPSRYSPSPRRRPCSLRRRSRCRCSRQRPGPSRPWSRRRSRPSRRSRQQ